MFERFKKLLTKYRDTAVTLITVYEAAQDMIFTRDLNGRYTSVNRHYAEYSGISRAELIGKTPYEVEIIPEEIVKNLQESDRQVLVEGKIFKERVWLTYNDGSKRFTETVKAPIIKKGKITGLLGMIRDVTEIKQALDELEKQNETLEDVKVELEKKSRELESALRIKRDFLARMSHEIRTPMNAIIGMTELALREKMSNTATEHILTVKQAGANILTIINDILDFSKIESGIMEIVKSGFLLSSMLCDVISIIRMRIVYTHVRFLVNIDSNLPNSLIGDETKLKQILINLLGNAVKYTEKGFVTLTVSGKVHSDDTMELKLVVADSGIGIKPEDQEKMFRDYIQVDVERNIGIEGVGLGLPITNGLTKAMGGNITLESEYGKGSVFTVELPLGIADYGKLAEVHAPSMSKTLVYERRTQTADSLVATIKNLGIECDLADNAGDFIKLLKTKKHAYVVGSYELLAGVKDSEEKLIGHFKVIGISESNDENEADSIASRDLKILNMPVHAISLANVYNNEDEIFSYSDEEDLAINFLAPDVRVLVVDDINTNLKVAKGLLSPYEMIVDLCESGSAAIEAVQKTRYDIVFMDHRMPGIDGMEATQIIRDMGVNDTYFSELPIVALTANAVTNMRDMFLNVGFNDFIPKPIDTVLLNSVLKKWIPKSKQRRYFSVDEYTKDTQGLENELKIDGVDVEKGVRITGGMQEVYLEILSTFIDEGSEKIAMVRESLDAGNLPLYTTTIHALKGALANIGATELSETAASLETAGDRKNLVYIESVNERFLTGLKRLFANIKTVLSDSSKSITADETKKAEDNTAFMETLTVLRKAIADMDAGVMNTALDTLMKQASNDDDAAEARKISKLILMADYDEAEELIDTLTGGV
jgi:PAS domain S-box-containing protein